MRSKHGLSGLYRARFSRFGEIGHLNKAVDYQSRVVQFTPEGDANQPFKLNGLAKSYLLRFDCLGKPSDLDKAVELLGQALPLIPHGHPERPDILDSLGKAYQFLFQRHGKTPYIDKAISCQQQALRLAPQSRSPEFVYSILSNIGNSYCHRFEQIGNLEDIDRAIGYHSQAALISPDSHFNKPALLSNLGNAYISRFDSTGKIEDLDKGISSQSQALQLTPDGHANNPGIFQNLGRAYKYRFERLGQTSDLEKMIKYYTQAVVLTTRDDAHLPGMLGNLGASYLWRFERFQELADLEKALDYLNRATLLSPNGHPSPEILNDLGMAYEHRFERLGDITDIDKAIDYFIQAMERTANSHPYAPSRLNNLGNAYLWRYERHGALDDVQKAIGCHTTAVELTPEGHADKPGRLHNLGNSYAARYDQLGRTSDIEKAVNSYYQAVLLTPDDHPAKKSRMNGLGSAYLSRFQRCRDAPDIEKGIEILKQALLLVPEGHPGQPMCLNNLGNAYLHRFKHLGESEDLNKAIEYQSKAVLVSRGGHADRPSLLLNLGNSYLHRFERQSDISDGESASNFFQEASQRAVTNPSMQLMCARRWAKSLLLLARSPEQAYQRAMELVLQVIWLGSTINQRYIRTIDLRDIVMEAAAWAISVQSYQLAVEWLEMGRSVVWNQIIQLRNPFDDLSTIDSILAQQLQDVGSKLELASSSPITEPQVSPIDSEQRNRYRHYLATEWDRLLSQARQLPGFHNFMSSRQLSDFVGATAQGAVVIINVHQSRCDALILRPNNAGTAHVPLRELSNDMTIGAREQLSALIGRLGTRSGGFRVAIHQPEFRRLLAMLWTDVAKPILDFLGYTQKLPIDELPRVTWCTIGALSFLPLHAAGYYDGSQANVPDLVVSSYTPTLSALTAAVPPASVPACGLLAVGQEHNKSLGSLPGTVDELAAIKEQTPAAHYSQLDGDSATVDAVLDSMDKHGWVHLACHATQDIHYPAESAFHLHDGDLTLEAITKRSFQKKGLAFLSACQTAAGSDLFPDEAAHLAAGMLMAGYPSVIATMWSIYDSDGPEVARRVYAELLKDGKMDHTKASRALHKAVAGLREEIGTDSFKRWVPFIHMGV